MNTWFAIGLWFGLGLIVALLMFSTIVVLIASIYSWYRKSLQRKVQRVAEYELMKWEGVD